MGSKSVSIEQINKILHNEAHLKFIRFIKIPSGYNSSKKYGLYHLKLLEEAMGVENC